MAELLAGDVRETAEPTGQEDGVDSVLDIMGPLSVVPENGVSWGVLTQNLFAVTHL